MTKFERRAFSNDLTFQLAEVFEAEIDPVMQSLGFCCGRKHTYSPQVNRLAEIGWNWL